MPNQLDIRDFMMFVYELEEKIKFKFKLPIAIISNKEPDLAQWPTRLLQEEFLGQLPGIDVQCPKELTNRSIGVPREALGWQL